MPWTTPPANVLLLQGSGHGVLVLSQVVVTMTFARSTTASKVIVGLEQTAASCMYA